MLLLIDLDGHQLKFALVLQFLVEFLIYLDISQGCLVACAQTQSATVQMRMMRRSQQYDSLVSMFRINFFVPISGYLPTILNPSMWPNDNSHFPMLAWLRLLLSFLQIPRYLIIQHFRILRVPLSGMGSHPCYVRMVLVDLELTLQDIFDQLILLYDFGNAVHLSQFSIL